MKRATTLLLSLLFPFCFFAQNTASGDKKVTITKRSTDADGSEVIETIVKKGKAAENFDAARYVSENRTDKVQVEVRIEEANAQYKDDPTGNRAWNIANGWLSSSRSNGLSWSSCDPHEAFLGVEEDSDEDADEAGLVVQVTRGSAADKAGLRNNDKITAIDGVAMNEWDDLTDLIEDHKAGDAVKIAYERNGKAANVELTLGKRSDISCQNQVEEHGYLGVSDQDDDSDAEGVEVSITKNSGAAKAGLKTGDVLLKLNDTPLKDFEDISDFMAYTKPGETIRVTYSRNGLIKTVDATLSKQKMEFSTLTTDSSDPESPVQVLRNGNLGDAFLGVQEDSDEDPSEKGLVVEVTRGSAADKAGLHHNDKILSVDGEPMDKWSDFSRFMKGKRPGEKIKINFERNGKQRSTEATLIKRSEVKCSPSPKLGFLGVSETGTSIGNEDGVVMQIVRNSAAEKAGLKTGDRLLLLDDAPISDFEDISDFMAYTEPGDTVEIQYVRNGRLENKLVVLGEEKSWDWSGWSSADSGTTGSIGSTGKDSQNMNFSVREKAACLGVYTDEYNEDDREGAKITDFTEISAAEDADLKVGDIILAVNNKRVDGQDELWEQIAQYKPGATVTIEFLSRDDKFNVAKVTLKACKEKDNRVQIYNVDEQGVGENREFFISGWNDQDQKDMTEHRVIPIRKAGEGSDAQKLNVAPKPAAIPVERRLKLDAFRAFPNPTQGQVTVSFNSQALPTVVSLFDLNGRQLFREELNAFNGRYTQEFDLSEYIKGSIIIQVSQGDKVFTDEILVSGS